MEHVDGVEPWTASIEPGPGMWQVRLTGEIDTVAAPTVRAILLDAVAAARRVEVDLAEVTFLDSGGLSALVLAWNTALADDGDLVVVNPSPRALRVLRVAGLSEVFMDTPVRARPTPTHDVSGIAKRARGG